MSNGPSAATSSAWPSRYHMIDAWRGLAALAVVAFHVAGLPFADVAIYVFFVISGYCVCASAVSSIKRGDGFAGFMKRRVRRIYPPYFASLVFFLATRLVKFELTGGGTSSLHPWYHWLQNLTLTQWVTMPFHSGGWTHNPSLWVAAHWSLNYEEQFYFLTALLVPLGAERPSLLKRVVVGLIVCSVVWNVWVAPPVHGLFIEYFALYGIGSLVYFRLCGDHSIVRRRAFDAFLLAAAAVTAVLPYRVTLSPDLHTFVRTMLVGSLFAVVLVLLRPLDRAFGRSYPGRPLMALGAVSYSLYLVHQFNLESVKRVVGHLTSLPETQGAAIALCLVGHLLIATAFWAVFERPFVNPSGRQSPLVHDPKGDPVIPHHRPA